MSTQHNLPVAVIGAGPVGLAAAAHLIAREIPVRVFESGDAVAAHIRSWGHVRLFSPWRYNTDLQAVALLSSHGWQAPPDDALPTGRELVTNYLEPLAQTPVMRAAIETQAYVRSVSRHGIDKVVSRGREKHPFVLTIQSHYGETRQELARAVIDASGTWQNPNPMSASGTHALGEVALEERAAYGIPDVLGEARDHFSGLRVLVVGGGHSAANVLLDLARLAKGDPHLRMTWAVRSTDLTRVFGGGAADQLPARGKLGADLKQLVASGRLKLVTGFRAERVDVSPYGFTVHGRSAVGPVAVGPVDRVIVATGQRPDLKMTRELRLDLDPWLECPRALGPMIDPNLHSCGTVRPHGYKELASGAGFLHDRHQELRTCAHVPDGHGIRTGPLHRGASCRRSRGRRRRTPHTPGNGCLLVRPRSRGDGGKRVLRRTRAGERGMLPRGCRGEITGRRGMRMRGHPRARAGRAQGRLLRRQGGRDRDGVITVMPRRSRRVERALTGAFFTFVLSGDAVAGLR